MVPLYFPEEGKFSELSVCSIVSLWKQKFLFHSLVACIIQWIFYYAILAAGSEIETLYQAKQIFAIKLDIACASSHKCTQICTVLGALKNVLLAT